MDKNELKSTKAYQRFIKELKMHQKNISTVCDGDTISILPEQIEEFQIIFHTIKGTAGFFGFERLADVSSTLEDLFLNKDLAKKSKEIELSLRQFVQECKSAITG